MISIIYKYYVEHKEVGNESHPPDAYLRKTSGKNNDKFRTAWGTMGIF